MWPAAVSNLLMWAWSVYFCEAAHEHMVLSTGCVRSEDNMVDFGPSPALSHDHCVWLGYIDNSFVASLFRETTARTRAAIDDEFTRRSLKVHEVSEVSCNETFLGMDVCK